ncbi:hypothetical protein ZIOFF_005497 [Zingiber officinale]|uniref:BZIP domain-containing protein n=1 Tax=Zingiber officinale TaxID=94328 RepID=A0A8J5HWQ5_ZINOF|nr:hypothetical protein ZIOFF_005497 [Zingiber officinale]
MDERETDFCASKDLSDEVVPSICSMGSFFDDLLNDGQHHQCTHTHTCNPPGPDLAHTHTCFHIHTKVLSADETAESAEKSSSAKRRPGGNREAVRKYREKKKAHAASLEDEIAHLRAINQQLIKRLQGQAALEAEIARMKCLLVDLRGRIEGEIGSFPYQKPVKGSGDFVPNIITRSSMPIGVWNLNSCSFQCDDGSYCLYPGTQSKNVGETGVRNVGNVQCRGSSNSGTDDFADCGGNGAARTVDCSSNAALTRIEGFSSFPLFILIQFLLFELELTGRRIYDVNYGGSSFSIFDAKESLLAHFGINFTA